MKSITIALEETVVARIESLRARILGQMAPEFPFASFCRGLILEALEVREKDEGVLPRTGGRASGALSCKR